MDLLKEKAITFPLTFENVEKDPRILTRFALSGNEDERRAFDGKVGNISKGDILTISPNANHLFAPPNFRRVRLRRDYHFGIDDPLYFPQPFRSESGHLALMLCPTDSSDDDFYPAWRTPERDQFCVINPSLGLGKLERRIHDSLLKLSHQVLNQVPADNNDTYLLSLEANLRRLMDRLDLPASMEKMFILVSQIQRFLLELNARSRWVGDEWQKRLKTAASHIRQPLVHTIGAFTESLDDLDILFYAGIPVWYVCMAKSMPYARINSVAPLLHEDYSQKLVRPGGFIVDCADTSPPHKVVYEGLPNKPDRYQKMAAYIDSLVNEPAMFLGARGSDIPTSKHLRSSNRRPEKPDAKESRFAPYARTKPKPPPMSNTFLVPNSIYMPTPLLNWERALRVLSEHNQALRTPAGVDAGFRVPPIRNIISPAKAETVQLLFHGWLRIRDVILTHLYGTPMRLTSKQWRCLLEVAGWRYGDPDIPTATGQRHTESRGILKRLYFRSDSETEDLSTVPISWNNRTLSKVEDLPTALGREILWELQELGFRNDLIALDTHLDRSDMNPAERRSLLNGCWEGTASYVDIQLAAKGLGAPTLQERWPYLRALHLVMRTWKGEKPELLLANLPDNGGDATFDIFIKRLEYTLADFFTISFLRVFGRAACIPYQL